MHYAEGRLIHLMVILLLMNSVKNGSAPFFSSRSPTPSLVEITSLFLASNFKTHYTFLEDQLEGSLGRGQFLCGKDLTAADILMSFPLEASQPRSGMSQGDFPPLWDRLHQREAYKRSMQKDYRDWG
jgi:glutathione S-transferase